MTKLKQTRLFLTIILFTQLILVQNAFPQNRQQQIVALAKSISGDNFTIVSKTPKGAKIYAASKPSLRMLRTVDQGLTDLFVLARKNNYRSRLNYADYTIFIARPDRNKDSKGNYSPDIAIGAAQYAGSVYDQGGYIYVAGMVINFDPSAFMIAEHDKGLERVSEVVRYEGEHLVLYHNDRALYEQTKDHSQGGGHPILK